MRLLLGSDPWPACWSASAVVAALEPLALERRAARFRQVIADRLGGVTLLVDQLNDPHNRAAIVRSCDAFGLAQIHVVVDEGDFELQRRVAAGTGRWVDMRQYGSRALAARAVAEAGFELLSAEPDGELEPEQLAELPRVALVLGNEHLGVDPALRPTTGRSVRVPMRGFVESLNVSVSAAVLLAAATRGRAGDLDAPTRQRLYARALFSSVPRSAEVLRSLNP